MVDKCPLLIDATCGIASKVNKSRAFYFAFIFYDREVKTEPVPILEIFTDEPHEISISTALNTFISHEKKQYGEKSNPLYIICYISWPIIKAVLASYNNLSLDEHIRCCFKILIGKATEKEPPLHSAIDPFVNKSINYICANVNISAVTEINKP